MAKKVVKKTEPTPAIKRAGVTQDKKEALKKGVNTLENAIKPKSNAATVTTEPPKVESPISSTETTKTETNTTDNANGIGTDKPNETVTVNNGTGNELPEGTTTPTEPIISQEKKGLSIWEDVKKSTEQDANLGKETAAAPAATNGIQALADEAKEVDQYTEDEARKQGYKVKASMIVEFLDTIFMILCCLITWEFSDENQRKFTLNKDRKKAIQFNLYQLYELEGKKVNPKKAMWQLVLGSYAPMLIIALLIMFNKMKEKKAAKEAAKIAAPIRENNSVLLEQERTKAEALAADRERLLMEIDALRNGNKVEPKKVKPNSKTTFIHTSEKTIGKRRGVQPGQKRGSYKK